MRMFCPLSFCFNFLVPAPVSSPGLAEGVSSRGIINFVVSNQKVKSMENLISESELRYLEKVIASETCPHCGKSCAPSIAFSHRLNIDRSSGVYMWSVNNCCCEERKRDIIDFLTNIANRRRMPRFPF